jgi:hypothetical protein
MPHPKALSYLLCLGSLFSVACKDKEPPPTYQADIRPVIDAYCLSCHSDGNIAPFELDNWETVEAMGPAIVAAVESRSMPPWAMDPDCQHSPGSQWLDDSVVSAFGRWQEGGFLEGDPADYIPGESNLITFDLSDPTIVLQPAEGYTPDLTKPDDYRCLPVSEPLEKDLFVTANRIQPTDAALTHHILLYAVPPHGQEELALLEAEDPEPGYVCFGRSGLDGVQTVGGWAPGGNDDIYTEGTAMKIPQGSQLVLQMHYNTAGYDGEVTPDLPTVELWTLAEGAVPDNLLVTFPIAKQTLDIKANDAASTQQSTQRIAIDGTIVSANPHMHLLGKEIHVDLVRDDGEEVCLTRVENWDFNWQRSYPFEPSAYLPVSVDDAIDITCIYDNSAENQPVVDGGRGEPQDVAWGDGSFDEMCLNYLAVVVPYYGDAESTGTCGGYENCIPACDPNDAFCTISCMTAQGLSCLSCGLQSTFGNCTISECLTEAMPMGACLDTCVESEEQLVDCLYDACREDFLPYWTCAQDVIAAGTCSSDYEGCPTIHER